MKYSVCPLEYSQVLKTDAVARLVSNYSCCPWWVFEQCYCIWQQPSTFRSGIENISVLIKLGWCLF